jgi:hypothetical protein
VETGGHGVKLKNWERHLPSTLATAHSPPPPFNNDADFKAYSMRCAVELDNLLSCVQEVAISIRAL